MSTSRLANLRELVQVLSLCVQVQREVSEILEDYESRIYALQEDNKRLLAADRVKEEKIRTLEKKYSEVLYKLTEFKDRLEGKIV